MIFSPEGKVSSQDYEFQIKAVCKMVSNKNHWSGAAEYGRSKFIQAPSLASILYSQVHFFRYFWVIYLVVTHAS